MSIFFHDCICDTFSLSYFPGFFTAQLYSETSKQLKINHTEIQRMEVFLENPVIDEECVETATCENQER